MSFINKYDVVAYNVDGRTVCPDCLTTDEESELRPEDFITENRLYWLDRILYCSECERPIN